MSEVPEDLKYLATHQWARLDDDGVATVGITDFAQEALGDVIFVELPQVGAQVIQGEEVCVVESVKSASDVYSPVTGEVVAVNEALEDAPEKINEDPYTDGWLYRVRLEAGAAPEGLLDAEQYREVLADEE